MTSSEVYAIYQRSKEVKKNNPDCNIAERVGLAIETCEACALLEFIYLCLFPGDFKTFGCFLSGKIQQLTTLSIVPSSTVGCFAERDDLTEREEEEEEEEELVARGLEHNACPR